MPVIDISGSFDIASVDKGPTDGNTGQLPTLETTCSNPSDNSPKQHDSLIAAAIRRYKLFWIVARAGLAEEARGGTDAYSDVQVGGQH